MKNVNGNGKKEVKKKGKEKIRQVELDKLKGRTPNFLNVKKNTQKAEDVSDLALEEDIAVQKAPKSILDEPGCLSCCGSGNELAVATEVTRYIIVEKIKNAVSRIGKKLRRE
jgi:hypothetical protein